jgi:small-conductance mechanosensitive channel
MSWLVVLILVILVGSFLFGASAVGGATDPMKVANSHMVDAQVDQVKQQLDKQKQLDAVDVEIYKQQQQVQVDAQKQQAQMQIDAANQQAAEQLAFQKAMHDQQLAQMNQQAQLDQQRQAQELKLLQEQIEAQRAEHTFWVQLGAALIPWFGPIVALVAACLSLLVGLAVKARLLPPARKGSRRAEWDVVLGQVHQQMQKQFDELRIEIKEKGTSGTYEQRQSTSIPVRGNGTAVSAKELVFVEAPANCPPNK